MSRMWRFGFGSVHVELDYQEFNLQREFLLQQSEFRVTVEYHGDLLRASMFLWENLRQPLEEPIVSNSQEKQHMILQKQIHWKISQKCKITSFSFRITLELVFRFCRQLWKLVFRSLWELQEVRKTPEAKDFESLLSQSGKKTGFLSLLVFRFFCSLLVSIQTSL
jgi:hypothetical protein